MSEWAGKKEQQIVFDGTVTRPSKKKISQGLAWHKDDGHIFLRKVGHYSKKIRRGGVIIDVGCGTGSLLKAISQTAPNLHSLIGIDISSKSVKIAKQKNKIADFIVCDIDNLPLRDNVSSMVIIWNVLHHLSTLKSLNKLIRILDSKGYLITDDKINGNPFQEILTSLYPLCPYSFKMVLREKGNHIDPDGSLPPIKRYSPKKYLETIQQTSNEMRIVEIRYHGFFFILGVLGIVSYFFPNISNLQIPIEKLRLIEKHKMLRWSAISMTIVAEKV